MTTTTTTSDIDALVDTFRALAALAPDGAVLEALRMLDDVVGDGDKTAFVVRAAEVLVDAASATSEGAKESRHELLAEARALEQSERQLGSADDILASAQLRGLLAKLWLLEEEGGVCTAEELGDLLGGLSRQSVARRRVQGRLLALDLGRGRFVYPIWQVGEGQLLPGLERVLAELDTFDPWMQAAFFLNPNTWLNGASPLSEMRRGNIERVVAVAATYAA